MYEVRTAGVKGLGVFAKRMIPRGTRIFSELPLLAIRPGQDAGDIYAASLLISPKARQRLMELSFHTTNESGFIRSSKAIGYTIKTTVSGIVDRLRGATGVRPSGGSIKHHVQVLNIFRSNAFNLSPSPSYLEAVFPGISRINHSCLPNAQGNFHEGLGTFNIHATCDISGDEEISLNYLPENGASRNSRRQRLLNGYGFECDCPACDLGTIRGLHWEQDRSNMHELLREAMERMESLIVQGEKAEVELRCVVMLASLYRDQNVAGRELSTLYLDAARICKERGDMKEALAFANVALGLDEDCLGQDHELYQNTAGRVDELRKVVGPSSRTISQQQAYDRQWVLDPFTHVRSNGRNLWRR